MLVAGIADPGWIAYNRMESGIIDAGYNKRGRRLPHSKALRELELAANVRKLFGCANSLALSSSRAERGTSPMISGPPFLMRFLACQSLIWARDLSGC